MEREYKEKRNHPLHGKLLFCPRKQQDSWPGEILSENNGLEAEVFSKGSRCGGACSRGPVMQVGCDRVFTGLTPEEAVWRS